MAVEITRASRDRFTPLASVLGRSFVIEPMMRWSLGDHADISERFTRAFAYFLEGLIPLDGMGKRAPLTERPSGSHLTAPTSGRRRRRATHGWKD